MGQPRHFRDVRVVSAFHPIATKSRTSRHFGFGPCMDGARGACMDGARVQEESDFSAKRSGAAMYTAYCRLEDYLCRDAAVMAAGPDVIR